MSERKCTGYIVQDHDEHEPTYKYLCRCPVCKGFLPYDFPTKHTFRCKKCGTELMTFPFDPEDEELGGRICPISEARKQ